jgi:hypothetical protein
MPFAKFNQLHEFKQATTISASMSVKADRIDQFMLHCMSPLLAQSGRREGGEECPLSGVKQTSGFGRAMSASDPFRKSKLEFAVVHTGSSDIR